jgi:mono/diheme cytochrome c family protein
VSATALAVTILAAAAVAVIAYLVWNAGRGRGRTEDVPPGLRPAYSDEQLERTILERYMGWGVVLTLFFAVFFPVYYLREQSRLNQANEGFFVNAVVRGEAEYQQQCARCHGANLAGGGAASPYNPQESWPAPALNNIVARYAENRNITDIHDFLVTTVQRGRPGTPMPTWGAAYGGPLTDQQIEDITAFILSQQVEEVAQPTAAAGMSGEQLFAANCAKCHGENLEGRVGPTLVGVFQRHQPETVLGILRNGIYVGNGFFMPPWQQGYTYPDARYTDEALRRVIEYLQSRQPAQLPAGVEGYQGPGATAPAEAAGAPTEGPGVEVPPEPTAPTVSATGV